MDEIIEALRDINWQYSGPQVAALGLLRDRIRHTGQQFGLISYSDLVDGVEFQYANVNSGRPFYIHAHDWSGLHRKIVGDCLGYISKESYEAAGVMASALVIGREESRPSEYFFSWMEDLGILPDLNEDTVLGFWTEEVRKAHQWYKYGRIARPQ